MQKMVNGKLVDMTPQEIAVYLEDRANEGRGINYFNLKLDELDAEVSREKYQDIKNKRAAFDEFVAEAVYYKHLYSYAIQLINTLQAVNKVLGVFPKYGDLPINAQEGDLAYNTTLSGVMLTKPSGIYQFVNGTWVLKQKILK